MHGAATGTSPLYTLTVDTLLLLYYYYYLLYTLTVGHIVTALFNLVYIAFIALANVYLETNMQKIRYSNFKETKKINLYIAIVVVTIVVSKLLYLKFFGGTKNVNGAIVKS